MSTEAPERRKSWVVLPEGRTFPDPADPNEVQWRLRYGQPTREDLMHAASVMAAYSALVHMPRGVRDGVVRDLRAASAAGQ